MLEHLGGPKEAASRSGVLGLFYISSLKRTERGVAEAIYYICRRNSGGRFGNNVNCFPVDDWSGIIVVYELSTEVAGIEGMSRMRTLDCVQVQTFKTSKRYS
jgi:hypothetical protein